MRIDADKNNLRSLIGSNKNRRLPVVLRTNLIKKITLPSRYSMYITKKLRIEAESVENLSNLANHLLCALLDIDKLTPNPIHDGFVNGSETVLFQRAVVMKQHRGMDSNARFNIGFVTGLRTHVGRRVPVPVRVEWKSLAPNPYACPGFGGFGFDVTTRDLSSSPHQNGSGRGGRRVLASKRE